MGTIIVSVILVIIVTAAIISLIRSKKRGKSLQCGGDCSKCGGCH
ncbi:MAG: FeoB-associated Cys-rich membrane protein [Lachnospiraceae bacterium]|nr:FeoB-associated Cys-rich membrane protein [Lachnospiraceae bacterium]